MAPQPHIERAIDSNGGEDEARMVSSLVDDGSRSPHRQRIPRTVSIDDDDEIRRAIAPDVVEYIDNEQHSSCFVPQRTLPPPPSVSPVTVGDDGPSHSMVDSRTHDRCCCHHQSRNSQQCRSSRPFKSNRVKFSSKVEIYSVIHRRDMTLKEKRRTWVTRLERAQMKGVSDHTVYLMKSGVGTHLTHDDYFCPRGLEHRWDASSANCRDEAYKSHKIALAMQRLLRRSRTQSPEMIARAYRKYTLKSRKIAYQRGLEDQQESEQQQRRTTAP